MPGFKGLLSFSILSLCHVASAVHPEFSRDIIAKVIDNMINTSTHAWEAGTMMQAITEVQTPELSVFGAATVPATSGTLPAAALKSLDDMLAKRDIELKPFQANGAAADPASVGVTATIAGILLGKDKYVRSAQDELSYLLFDVPKDIDGVLISHRKAQFQAWADYVAMVPPFLAYQGVTVGGDAGEKLLRNAYAQCKGYRDILREPETKLWHHILKGNWSDTGLWATGQGWGAYGMLRVQQTIVKSVYASSLVSEAQDLLDWVEELVDATWAQQLPTGAVFNYMDKKDFEDSTGTAVVALSSYRHSIITKKPIPEATGKALQRIIDLTGADGWLQNVTDPYSFAVPGQHSPEAQAFTVMLDVASREYYASIGDVNPPPSTSTDVPTTTDSPTTSTDFPTETTSTDAPVTTSSDVPEPTEQAKRHARRSHKRTNLRH